MDFSKLNTNVLREMLKLSERKEALLDELKKLEAQIVSHLSGHGTTFSKAIKTTSKKDRLAPKTRQRAVRGAMKQQILEALTKAGHAGLKVPDLAQQIGAKNANVHVWLSSAGKKLSEIERIGAGHFRIRQND